MSEFILIKNHVWAKTTVTMELRKKGYNDLRICRCCSLIKETNRQTMQVRYILKQKPPEGIQPGQCYASREKYKELREKGTVVELMAM
jgi:hypothetical protein